MNCGAPLIASSTQVQARVIAIAWMRNAPSLEAGQSALRVNTS